MVIEVHIDNGQKVITVAHPEQGEAEFMRLTQKKK